MGLENDTPLRDVEIVGGATSRTKRVRVVGDGTTLAAKLEKLVGAR